MTESNGSNDTNGSSGSSGRSPLVNWLIIGALVVVGLLAIFWLMNRNDSGQSGTEPTPTEITAEGGATEAAPADGTPTIEATAIVIATADIPTPAPNTAFATATTAVNVRSGPGSNFHKVGLLQEGQSAPITGRNEDSSWWMIAYPPAASNQGWVASEFVVAQNVENVPVIAPPPAPEPTAPPPVAITDWMGEYFNNRNLSGDPALVRNDEAINFAWGTGSPAPEIQTDNFSARWTITRNVPAGTYRFTVWVDDGVRIFVDNVQVLNQWHEGTARNYVVDVKVAEGEHTVRVEYFEAVGGALIQVDIGYLTAQPTPPPSGSPQAVITGPTQAKQGETVTFSAGNSIAVPGTSITQAEWDFGDGDQASGETVTHVYAEPGSYIVNLAVTDSAQQSGAASQKIDILEDVPTPEPGQPPIAIIVAPSEAQVGTPVRFDGSHSQGSEPIVSYAWDFGDGSNGNGVQLNKIYNATGSYNVLLTVTDTKGQEGSSTRQINIVEAAPTEVPPTPEPEQPTAEPATATPEPEPEQPTAEPATATPEPEPEQPVAPAEGVAPISGTSWQLASYLAAEGPAALLEGTQITAVFAEDGALSGSGGCNAYNGTYTATADTLAVGPLAATQSACGEEIDAQEAAYLANLQASATYEISEGQLIIRDGNGQELLRYNQG